MRIITYELLDQLAPKYEEMQRILDYIPEPSRKILLGNALSSQSIPKILLILSMHKELTGLRKAKTWVMMLNDLTAFYRTGEAFTKEFLKLLLKQKEYRHLTNRIN